MLVKRVMRLLRFLTSPRRIRDRIVRTLRLIVLGPYAYLPGSHEAMTAQTFEVFGVMLKSFGRLDEAADMLTRVVEANPHAVNSYRYLAEVRFCQRQTDAALTTILRSLNIPVGNRRFPLAEPATLTFPGTGHRPPAGPRRITVATSLMPKRFSMQKAAVASWRDLGFDVVSVNTQEEQAILAPQFPDIHFVVPSATAEHLCGRPMIMINALLEVLKAADCDFCGVVNSDIVIANDPAFRRTIEAEYRNSLVFGHRIDLNDARNAAGTPFTGGYDFFFFEKEAIPLFSGTNLVLGMPWWDFWMPIAAWLGGLAVKKLDAPMVMHLVHPVGYQEEFFCSFSGEFISAANRLAEQFAETSVNQIDIFPRRFYSSLAAHLATSPVVDAAMAGTLCAFTNFLINTIAGSLTVTDRTFGAVDRRDLADCCLPARQA